MKPGFYISPGLLRVAGPLLALGACQIDVEAPPEGPRNASPVPSSSNWDDDHSHPDRGYDDPDPPRVDDGYERDEDDAEDRRPWWKYRDLIAIDPELVQGEPASNANPEATLSFRAQMQWLAGASGDAAAFTHGWLEQWATLASVGPDLAPVTPRPAVRELLIEPWLYGGATPAAAPDAGYAEPGPVEPGPVTASWERAPFRLIAVVNRVDLADDACSGFAGELRYVYAAYDVATERDLDMTVIIEIPYPSTPPASFWARAWSELAQWSPGDAYAAEFEAMVRDVMREADPLRVRVRTNEIALAEGTGGTASWEMREFQVRVVDRQLALVQVPLEFTPRADVAPAALSEHVLLASDPLRTGAVPLPAPLRAGAAQLPTADFSWPVLGVSESLRRAFSAQTCNGCHGGDSATLPFQHIAPGASPASRARLSRFLYDPGAESDELRRRAARATTLGQTACDPPTPPVPYGS